MKNKNRIPFEIIENVVEGTGSNIQCHMSLQKLAIALSRKLDFTKVLSAKVRALAEEGDYNKSILSL